MKALILAAGYGTRLYSIVKDKPKALLDINGRSLINHILEKIIELNGLNEIIVVTNDKFYGHFQDWAKEQVNISHKITIVNDGTKTPEDRLGSIGDIEFAINDQKIDDDLLVVGGDNLFDYNVDDYIAFAQSKPEAITMGLYDLGNLEEAKLFGVAAVDANKKITSFEEKPAQPKSSLVAMCFYYLPRQTLGLVSQYLKETAVSDTAGDYIRWLYQKHDVYGFTFTGKWYDIGSVEAYNEAKEKFK
ncbi:MAG: nucleotidyltransferase family protein [Candidatus Omnitrophica bacterium]|nr:nucleotidyltransferase family protein [Candidatus Omnitrophota bacterium]